MTIPLLSLDDRNFDDLLEELQSLIPRYDPEWTDRNTSDPGIMLVELLAWLTESQMYRINRVPKEVYLAFFRWLIGDTWTPNSMDLVQQLEEARRVAYELFSHPLRLISKGDYERVIIDWFGEQNRKAQRLLPLPHTLSDSIHNSVRSCVARVHCVPERDLTSSSNQGVRRGHLSVVLLAQPVVEPLVHVNLLEDVPYQYQISPSRNRLIVFGRNEIQTWTASSPTKFVELHQLLRDETIRHCAISADDSAVAIVYEKGTTCSILSWKADNSIRATEVELGVGAAESIHFISLAGQDGPLAIQHRNLSVQIWWYLVDENGGNSWQTVPTPALMGKVYLRKDGFRITAHTETSLQSWRIATKWLAEDADLAINGRIIVVSDCPHQFAAVIDDADQLSLWDLWRCTKVWTRSNAGSPTKLEFTRDSNYLLLKTKGGVERLDVLAGSPIVSKSVAQDHILAQSNNGKRFATIANDMKTVRVWNSERNDELAVFETSNTFGPEAVFSRADFLADDRFLLTELILSDVKQPQALLAIWEVGFDAVEKFVADYGQVGIHCHVVAARYVDFAVDATVTALPNNLETKILEQLKRFFDSRLGGPKGQGWPFGRDVMISEVYSAMILEQLIGFFDSRSGGPKGQGWPFGRDVTISEVYSAIHEVPGVVRITKLALRPLDSKVNVGSATDVQVNQYELVNFVPSKSHLSIHVERRSQASETSAR